MFTLVCSVAVSLGSFFFDAPATARVAVDNTGTTGCVAVSGLELVPASGQRPSTGCTDSAALNFEPAASTDDGSCLYRGGRGLLRQQWGLLPTAAQQAAAAAASPASVASAETRVDAACPVPGTERGWQFLSGDGRYEIWTEI